MNKSEQEPSAKILSLFSEKEIGETIISNLYYPELNTIAGSMLGGIFLSRAIHWWRKSGNSSFHKANTPKGDPSGRSWAEQEGFQTRYEFEAARKAVTTRVKKKDVKEYSIVTPAMLDDKDAKKRCVLYWRNGTGRMWYRVNEALVVALLLKHITPERDNADILREVKAKFPNATIEFPDIDPDADANLYPDPAPPAPEPKPIVTTPSPKNELKSEAPTNTVSESKSQPKPKLTKPQTAPKTSDEKSPAKPNRLRIAIAYSFGFLDDNKKPNEKAPLIGSILTQFVGNAKPGKRDDYTLKEHDFKPELIVAFALWYQDVARRGNYSKRTLPIGAESLHKNALSFLSTPPSSRDKWINEARRELALLMGEMPPLGSYTSPEAAERLRISLNLPPVEVQERIRKQKREIAARKAAEAAASKSANAVAAGSL